MFVFHDRKPKARKAESHLFYIRRERGKRTECFRADGATQDHVFYINTSEKKFRKGDRDREKVF